MEIDRFRTWIPGLCFLPAKSDMAFCDQTAGKYTMEGRVALIRRWRTEARDQTINAIITMMTGGLQ